MKDPNTCRLPPEVTLFEKQNLRNESLLRHCKRNVPVRGDECGESKLSENEKSDEMSPASSQHGNVFFRRSIVQDMERKKDRKTERQKERKKERKKGRPPEKCACPEEK